MSTVSKTMVATEIGPTELAAGVVYVHDVELPPPSTAATGSRWRLVIEP